MNFETTSLFDKQFKKLYKKYNLLKKDISYFVSDFDDLHKQSTKIQQNLFKIRLANSNKNKGKSAGYRIYYYIKLEENIYLLTIYDKSAISMIDEKILINLIRELN